MPLYGRVSVGEPLEGMHDLHTDRVSPVVEKAYWVRYLSRPESARMLASCFRSVGNIDNNEKSRLAKIIKRKCFLVSTKS